MIDSWSLDFADGMRLSVRNSSMSPDSLTSRFCDLWGRRFRCLDYSIVDLPAIRSKKNSLMLSRLR